MAHRSLAVAGTTTVSKKFVAAVTSLRRGITMVHMVPHSHDRRASNDVKKKRKRGIDVDGTEADTLINVARITTTKQGVLQRKGHG